MSGFYIGVDGKARKVKGGYIGVDGKARKIKKGYIGDENGVARLCWSASLDPVFANNTWEDVIAACQNNTVPDTWTVGDQLTMTIDGTDYAVDIIGKNHDDYSDGSGKAPLTFQLHDCYKTGYALHNSATTSGSWSKCRMRTTHLPNILAQMPIEVQNGIREVKKITSDGYGYTTYTTTNDKLFLVSEKEVRGTSIDAFAGEGTRYAYYKSKPLTKAMNGSNSNWWLRSPYKGDTDKYVYINNTGANGLSSPTTSYGVSFAFCF